MDNAKSELAWCRIHLVPQNENNMMPETITGILTQETNHAYVLMKVLTITETEDGWETVLSENMDFINRTYVWRLEMLKEPPQLGEFGQTFNDFGGGGGLG